MFRSFSNYKSCGSGCWTGGQVILEVNGEGRWAPAALVRARMMLWQVQSAGGRNPSKGIVNDTLASGALFLMMSFPKLLISLLNSWLQLSENVFLWQRSQPPYLSPSSSFPCVGYSSRGSMDSSQTFYYLKLSLSTCMKKKNCSQSSLVYSF